jgi:hypothetical protein
MAKDTRLLLMEFLVKQLTVLFAGSSHLEASLPMALLAPKLGIRCYPK